MQNDYYKKYADVLDTLVIIPNYNQLDLLKKCIFFLKKQTSYNFSVLIVDNGSSDEVVSYIVGLCNQNDNYYNILLSENTGFAIAVNKGLQFALDKGFEYSILLNNDCFVEEEFVEKLQNAIWFRKKYFAINSLMIKDSNKQLVDDFGDSYNVLGYAFQNKTNFDVAKIKKDNNVFSACGGASIYSNDVLKEIGFFDENFFCYLEDVDLSYRAKLYGYRIGTCYNARCYHMGSATSGSKYNDFKVRLSSRNNIYLLYKNMPLLQLIINFIPLCIGTLLKQIYFIKKGFGKAYFDGICDGIKNLINNNKIKRVCFIKVNIFRFVIIEIELIFNTIRYVIEFFMRNK